MTVVEFRKPNATRNQGSYNREARRLAASKPRNSKNGTPEERAAKAGPVVERVRIPRRSKNGTPEQRAAKKASAPILEIAPRRADRIVANVVKLLKKDDAPAKSRAPRETMAERRESLSILATALGLDDQSDPGPSAA